MKTFIKVVLIILIIVQVLLIGWGVYQLFLGEILYGIAMVLFNALFLAVNIDTYGNVE